MRKTFIKRALLGIPLGVSIGYTQSIIFSLIFARGHYNAIHPELITIYGSEINAIIIQAGLWGLIGFVYSGFSVLWEKDDWSLFKQTVVVFFVYLFTLMIIGYILKWFSFNFLQVIIFTFIFIFIFSVIWIFIYFKTKKDVTALNLKLKKSQ